MTSAEWWTVAAATAIGGVVGVARGLGWLGPVGSRRRYAIWWLGGWLRAVGNVVTPGLVMVAVACVAATLAGRALDQGRFGAALTLSLVSILAGRWRP